MESEKHEETEWYDSLIAFLGAAIERETAAAKARDAMAETDRREFTDAEWRTIAAMHPSTRGMKRPSLAERTREAEMNERIAAKHRDAASKFVELRDMVKDASDQDALREMLAELLNGVADAIRGPAAPLTMHDWSRLPEEARAIAADRDAKDAEIKRLRAENEALRADKVAVDWVLNDAAFKAPEQFDWLSQRWLNRLRSARHPSPGERKH